MYFTTGNNQKMIELIKFDMILNEMVHGN